MQHHHSIKIFSFYYKPGRIITSDPIYFPIFSGKNGSFKACPIPGDDTGDNITSKNKYFSELTGIYWVWKNTKQDITGCCHYRRFFTVQPEPFLYQLKRFLYFPIGLFRKRFGLIYTKNTKLFIPRIISQNEIEALFQKYDAILPQARKLKYSVETHFKRYHDINDLNLLESIINKKHPEFLEAFHEVLKGKRLYANNMFILKDEHFQEFMNWWFDVLFEFERRVDLSKYTGYQQRIFGFIGERLLNVWFRKKKLNCIELQIIYFKHFKFE
jgi:hypothetical protein